MDGENWMRSGEVLWMRFIIDAQERVVGHSVCSLDITRCAIEVVSIECVL
jgi:hypothetical protein